MPHPDAVIVGGGIVGCACARALAADGLRVTLLESDFVGSGATSAGMGHIVVMDDSEAQFALTAWSRALLDDMLTELPASIEHVRAGTMWVAEDDDQLSAAQEKREFYIRRGVAAELLNPRELHEAEPALRRGLAGALRVPGDSVIYPPALAGWLAQSARRSGVVIREHTRVERIGPRAVDTTDGRITADIVINAAGAAAPALTDGLPIAPRRGHLLITDRYPGLCGHQIVELGYLHSAHGTDAPSVAFNVQPRITGQILIGSSRELAGWDPQPNREILGRMLARAVSFMPSLARVSAIRSWIGFRPATPDKLPLIGRWPETDGLWIAAGHEGLGITTALGTARLLSDLIAGRTPAIDAAPFAPARVMSAAA